MKQTLESAQEKSLERMTSMIEPLGMIQHGILDKPDRKHPYSIDDIARAGIILARENNFKNEGAMNICLDYLAGAKESRADWLANNYRNRDGIFIGRDGNVENSGDLHDCFGRYLWALSEISNSNYSEKIKQRAKNMFNESLEDAQGLNYLMSKSLASIGLSKFPEQGDCPSEKIIQINNNIIYPILQSFEQNSNDDWKGYSNIYTYCAARPAQALILAGEKLNYPELIDKGEGSLDFLIKNTIINGMFNPIGNKGFFKKGSRPAKYDQQTIETGVMIEGLIDAYNVTGKKKYLYDALTCFSWFNGNNLQNVNMVADNGGVLDAITPNGANLNQGAESVISYLMALSKFKEINVDPFKN